MQDKGSDNNLHVKQSPAEDAPADSIGLERRRVLQVLAGLALGVGGSRSAAAASGEIVLSNWGGTAEKAIIDAFAQDCLAKLNKKLVVDGSGPLAGKVRAMVQSNHVIWDVIDLDIGNSAQLGAAGMIQPIDYNIVDKASVLPGLAKEFGISNYLYSYIFAVNEKKVRGPVPKTWADFWNVKDFPGKRGLPGSSQGVMEAALLADGVPPEKLYPLDLDRAVAKVREIKDHAVFWKTGAQSEAFLRQGEVVANLMWSNRAVVVRRGMKEITWTWDKAILASSGWAVPVNNPAGKEDAMKLIQLTLSPAGQAKVFEVVGMSPSNPAATALIPEAERSYNATGFADVQVVLNDEWYAKNSAAQTARYLEAISG